MEITKDTFMDILGLPEWDDRVIAVLKQLELEKPVVKEGEVYAYLSSKKYGIDLMFDYDCITPEQKEMEENANLYLSQVSFIEETPLPLPFGIVLGDCYNTIVEKIGKTTDTEEKYLDDSCEWELLINNTPFSLYCIFKSEKLDSLKSIWMRVQLPLSDLK